MADLHQVLDQIVSHLTVRQETKNELHQLVDQLREDAGARQAARKSAQRPEPGEKG